MKVNRFAGDKVFRYYWNGPGLMRDVREINELLSDDIEELLA
jgi:hypothetical protein